MHSGQAERHEVIGDEHAGVAAVVDPRFEVDEYLELARFCRVCCG